MTAHDAGQDRYLGVVKEISGGSSMVPILQDVCSDVIFIRVRIPIVNVLDVDDSHNEMGTMNLGGLNVLSLKKP